MNKIVRSVFISPFMAALPFMGTYNREISGMCNMYVYLLGETRQGQLGPRVC